MASRNRRRKTPSDEVGAHLCRLIAQANEGALEAAEAEGNARSCVNPHVAALQTLLEDGCSEASACLQAVMPYAWVPGPESPIATRIVVSADTLSDAHLDLATPLVGSPEAAVRRGAEQACRWLRTGSSRLRAAVHALRSTRVRTRRLGWKLLMNAGPISPALFMESVGDLPASTGLFEAFHTVAGRSHADGAAIALRWIWNTDLAIAAAALEWLERHVPIGVLRRRIAAAVPSAHGTPLMADGRVHAALEKVLDLFRTSGSAMHPAVAWELVRHGANEGAEAGFSMLCAEYERRAAHVRCGDLIAFLLEQVGARQPRVALPRSIRRAMQVVGDPTAMGVIFAALPQGAVPHRALWSWWTCAPECPALWPLLLASTAADDEWSRRRTPVPRSTPAPALYRERISVLRRIRRWATRIARVLIGPVEISMQHGDALGQAGIDESGVRTIRFSGILVLRDGAKGIVPTMGLVMHEIGHHLFDLGHPDDKVAMSKLRDDLDRDLHNLLCDERLERKLRGMDPRWGRWLDRLLASEFRRRTVTIDLRHAAARLRRSQAALVADVDAGRLPGTVLRVAERDGSRTPVGISIRFDDAVRIGLPHPFAQFAGALRCGMRGDEIVDPRVRAALALVPSNLSSATHLDLLRLGRGIRAALGLTRRLDQHDLLDGWGVFVELGRDRPNDCYPMPGRRAAVMLRGAWNGCSNGGRGAGRGERRRGGRGAGMGGVLVNTNAERRFDLLVRDERLAADLAKERALLRAVAPQALLLRPRLARLGKTEVELAASPRGHRLDVGRARLAAFAPRLDLLMSRREVEGEGIYLGILIDRSGSMSGDSIALAQRMAATIVAAAAGLPGIDGSVDAFDDRVLYRLGHLRRHAIASLEAGGGNNDAGALARAAELAFASRAQRKMIVMISDGMPTECTVAALRGLVRDLARRGMLLAQVAVKPLTHVTFPHHLDVSALVPREAVLAVGKLVLDLAEGRPPRAPSRQGSIAPGGAAA